MAQSFRHNLPTQLDAFGRVGAHAAQMPGEITPLPGQEWVGVIGSDALPWGTYITDAFLERASGPAKSHVDVIQRAWKEVEPGAIARITARSGDERRNSFLGDSAVTTTLFGPTVPLEGNRHLRMRPLLQIKTDTTDDRQGPRTTRAELAIGMQRPSGLTIATLLRFPKTVLDTARQGADFPPARSRNSANERLFTEEDWHRLQPNATATILRQCCRLLWNATDKAAKAA